MPFQAGSRVGPYEIVAPLGQGGMGEVYRARDTKLGRDVALKTLPSVFVADPERLARFQREAQLLASLSHPNIGAIHGLDDSAGSPVLVLELVEGPTLADRIAQGPMPLDEALAVAKQIAAALDAAHEQGIVHRDLKPANIKIRSDGTVKVLDFGLARLTGAETGTSGSRIDVTASPTITSPAMMTGAGMILGTAAYMAPEQARGRTVDKRADIWAFGVVLYEMVTGERLFHGEDVTETLAAVMMKQPDWDRVPPQIRPLLRRCLERDPKARLRDIGDALTLVATAPDAAAAPLHEAQHGSVRTTRGSLVAWAPAIVAVLAAAGLAFVHLRETPPAPPNVVRFQFVSGVTPAGSGGFSISPDGRKLAFAGVGTDGQTRLYLRALDSLDVRPLAGTESGGTEAPPFWSPDSRYLAFGASGHLKKIDITGGPAQTLCDVPAIVVGGAWNREGVIVFGLNSPAGLMRVSESGGTAASVTGRTGLGPSTDVFPSFLPDGRHFVYLSLLGESGRNGVYLGTLDGNPPEQRKLLSTTYGAAYVGSAQTVGTGTLLFRRESTLMAQAFDERSLALSGEAVPVAEQLGSYLAFGYFSASDNGVLVYRTGTNEFFQLTWFDTHGKPAGRAGEAGFYNDLALSSDGKQVALARLDYQKTAQDLWLLDFGRETTTRFTFGPGVARSPVWSPDGSRIAFRWSRDSGVFDLYQKLSSGTKDAEELLKSPENKEPTSWSHDGRFLMYTSVNATTRQDLWVLSLDDRKPSPVLVTPFDESNAQFSPDARWYAYVSNESGRNEIYVRPFRRQSGEASGPEGKWMVSKGGGFLPKWRPDGKALAYISLDRKLMVVDINATTAIQAGTPLERQEVPRGTNALDRAGDGRVLAAVPAEQSAQTPHTVVLNWQAGLKR